MEPMPVDLLVIHMTHHPWLFSSIDRYRHGMLVLRCPIPGCKKINPKQEEVLTRHLLTHPAEERCSNSEKISEAGYDYGSCRPVCPLCGVCLDSGNYRYSKKNPRLEHLQMHDTADLYHHRRLIFSICQNFGSSEVFHDILPKDRRDSNSVWFY